MNIELQDSKTTQVKAYDMSNVPYDPRWPEEFQRIKLLLSGALGRLALDIQHVGSTAVPGLSAKPRLDIDVVVLNAGSVSEAVKAVEPLGYYPQGELGVPGRMAFGRRDDGVPYDGKGTVWTKQNLYVVTEGSNVLKEHVAFRDALLANPKIAQEYEDLKCRLSDEFRNDQAAYVQGKTNFVKKVLESL